MKDRKPIRAILFDFDGTISTLRCGWEQVMKPLMLEQITGGKPASAELEQEVDAYIDASTGIQTIHQMKWLAETVQKKGMRTDAPTDPWWYKAEYNRRLMEQVDARLSRLESGAVQAADFLMMGSVEFLQALRSRGVRVFVASGTDHPDVIREAKALGVFPLFDQIVGAPVGSESCAKEQVIAQLIQQEHLGGEDFAVCGDGKVEIRLGREAGARTIGLASNERQRCGVDPTKLDRLTQAGAELIVGDFLDAQKLLMYLGL